MGILDRLRGKSSDPYAEEQKVLDRLLDEHGWGTERFRSGLSPESSPAARQVLDADRAQQARFVLALAARLAPIGARLQELHGQVSRSGKYPQEWQTLWKKRGVQEELLRTLLRRELPMSVGELASLLDWTCSETDEPWKGCPVAGVVQAVEFWLKDHELTDEVRERLELLRGTLERQAGNSDTRKLLTRLAKSLGHGPVVVLTPGEAWSDAALVQLETMSETQRSTWHRLLAQCQSVTSSAPNTAWLKAAKTQLEALGLEEFKRCTLTWFPLVDKPRTKPLEHHNPQTICDPHADLLKGLAWCCGLVEDRELSRALTALALSAYRKLPGIGPRLVKVGNACVTALGMMPGMESVGPLALLKVKVKFGTAQKMIEKALNVTAERVGIPREELEEMAVPAYGLTEVGHCDETMGEFTARLTVTGTNSTELVWVKTDGKVQRSVPAPVKEKRAEDLKELKAAAKDIEKMLPAQRERIDSLFLQQKTWQFPVWRERYLDHPLVGVLARRMLWEFTTAGRTTTGIFFNGQLADVDLKPLENLSEHTTVQLWHPIGKPVEEIVAWRDWLDTQRIQQPFKQAHREVYLLTDAERQTRVFSNRFAAHVIKQHQFNALCALRGWKNKLRLMVDDEYPPATLLLPKWGLRAEFWVEGAGTEYGSDTNESGVYLRLTTDQVRFYKPEARQRTAHASGGGYHPGYRAKDSEAVPLEEIPQLVFSEVMRDVDLFVGVTSVGNDPTWSDGGPAGRYRDYWQNYSFGDLNASAKTRKEVLERLVPRLKIASQCSFVEKFLVVRGSRRTYKIHLGSGNILMSPNDQYLCIVPKLGGGDEGKVFLPFEGDRTLSVILSKAFVLAEDAKIKDSTIVSQLNRK